MAQKLISPTSAKIEKIIDPTRAKIFDFLIFSHFLFDSLIRVEFYSNKTFAELGTGIKNNISHRAKAVQKLADYLLKR